MLSLLLPNAGSNFFFAHLPLGNPLPPTPVASCMAGAREGWRLHNTPLGILPWAHCQNTPIPTQRGSRRGAATPAWTKPSFHLGNNVQCSKHQERHQSLTCGHPLSQMVYPIWQPTQEPTPRFGDPDSPNQPNPSTRISGSVERAVCCKLLLTVVCLGLQVVAHSPAGMHVR